jgi:hypothetical protein
VNLIGVLHLLVRPGKRDDEEADGADEADAPVDDDDGVDEGVALLLIGSSFKSCC